MFLACVLTLFVVSLLTPAPDAESIRSYVWSREMLAESRVPGTPWYTDYRAQAGLLLIVTFIIVGYFL
jgi:hypothetical protein